MRNLAVDLWYQERHVRTTLTFQNQTITLETDEATEQIMNGPRSRVAQFQMNTRVLDIVKLTEINNLHSRFGKRRLKRCTDCPHKGIKSQKQPDINGR